LKMWYNTTVRKMMEEKDMMVFDVKAASKVNYSYFYFTWQPPSGRTACRF